jgi:peptidoglycan hydrolase CwlO-like protein
VKQLQELQGEVDDKDAIIAKLQGEVDQLQAENRDLRIANAKLEGRIQELERLLKCEGSLS